MTSTQYEVAITAEKHGGHECKHGTCHCCGDRAVNEIKRIMSEIRMSGKCGEFTVKWNGSAWEIRRCDAPVIVRGA